MALPAFARYKPLLQQLISISCLPGKQQQTCSSRFATVAALGPCWDRQTDGQTDTVQFHRLCSTYHAGQCQQAMLQANAQEK